MGVCGSHPAVDAFNLMVLSLFSQHFFPLSPPQSPKASHSPHNATQAEKFAHYMLCLAGQNSQWLAPMWLKLVGVAHTIPCGHVAAIVCNLFTPQVDAHIKKDLPNVLLAEVSKCPAVKHFYLYLVLIWGLPKSLKGELACKTATMCDGMKPGGNKLDQALQYTRTHTARRQAKN